MDVTAQYYLEFRIQQDIHMYRAAIFSLLGKTPQSIAIYSDKSHSVFHLLSFYFGKLEYTPECLLFLFLYGNRECSHTSFDYMFSIFDTNVVLYFFRHI